MRGRVLALGLSAFCAAGCYQSVALDMLPDAGTDAGTDAGMDAGSDAGTDADVPDASVPVMGCLDLCDTVLGWSPEQLNCIAQVLRIAGYAPGATPECATLEDPEECLDCADGMGLTDNVCIGLAFICLP